MMKRGFIHWDKREVSEADFQARKDRILARMKDDGLSYLLVYGDVWQCDDVQYLCNFNTYTRDCLLVLSGEGKMSLVSSMTPRDREWIAGFTPVPAQDIFFAAGLLKGSEIMKKGGFSTGKVGLVGDFFPKVLFEHLKSEFTDAQFLDLSETYRALRTVKDSAELALIKRASLLAATGAKALQTDTAAGRKETSLSAQAEWIVRSRGGEDYHFFCTSKQPGFLDFPQDREVKDAFSFTLMTQYKGCWAVLGRTWLTPEAEKRDREAITGYRMLVSEIQKEGAVENLENLIARARAERWSVEMKAPVGPDAPSSVIPGLECVPREKNAVFSLAFHRESQAGLLAYVETIRIGEEGYEVLTS
jgi:hypothetical protein